MTSFIKIFQWTIISHSLISYSQTENGFVESKARQRDQVKLKATPVKKDILIGRVLN